jgi:acetyl esterase/lipase
MKYTVILAGLVLCLASCKKDEGNNNPIDNTPLAAELKMDVAYGSDPLQKMDVYLPAGRKTDSTKVIIMVHGGAWADGDKTDFNSFVALLKQRMPDYAIFNINYRLATATSNAFPAQENDMKAALAFILQKKDEYHISDKLILLGASAGGHMALLQAYKYNSPKIKAVVDYFGPADMTALYNQSTAMTQMGLQILLGGTPSSNATLYLQSSPTNFLDAGDPPTIIFHGLNDSIVSVSQSTSLQMMLQNLGIPNALHTYPGVGHDIWPSNIINDTFDKAEAFVKANVH